MVEEELVEFGGFLEDIANAGEGRRGQRGKAQRERSMNKQSTEQ